MLRYKAHMANVIAFPDKLCRVLVIDANPATAANVRDALAKISPRVRVYSAPDINAACTRLSRETWDLVVLKPWQAQPGKPTPISLIRKAGYNGAVVPVTAGGAAIKRIPKGQRPATPTGHKPITRRRNTAMKSKVSHRSGVNTQIARLLDEAFTGA